MKRKAPELLFTHAMKLYYLNKHQSCPQYIGSRPLGFVLFTGKKGESITNILPIPTMLFVLSGTVKLHFGKYEDVIVGENQMTAILNRDETYVSVEKDCLCVRLYIIGDGLEFCHRILPSSKLTKTPGVGKVLEMIPEVRTIMRQLTGYISDGILCCNIHQMKQLELAAVLQAYYRPTDLMEMIAPIYNPDTKFYNDVMKYSAKFPPIRDIAKRMNMSYPTFIRHFKKVFNTSPMEWMSKIRTEQLVKLLRNSPRSEREIAGELMFSTVSKMRAFCKARTGLTTEQIINGEEFEEVRKPSSMAVEE